MIKKPKLKLSEVFSVVKSVPKKDLITDLINQYGGGLTLATRLYYGLNQLDTVKENPLLSNINKTVSAVGIGYDVYARVERLLHPYIYVPEPTESDKKRLYIAELLGCGEHNWTHGRIDISTALQQWIIEKFDTLAMVQSFHDITDKKKLNPKYALDPDHIFPYVVKVIIDERIYLLDVTRDHKTKTFNIDHIFYDDETNTHHFIEMYQQFEMMYINDLGYDKNVLRYNGTTAVAVPRSAPVDVEIECLDIKELKSDIETVLNNGERKGYMFAGNPGTGKTTVLLKIENELTNFPIIYTTADNLCDSNHIDRFDKFLTKFKKCVVFIEDFDSMGIQEKNRRTHALLSMLDGQRRTNAVVFIATINDSSLITDSVARTGRFDEIIDVHEPRSDKAIYHVLRFNWKQCKGTYEGFPEKVTDISRRTYKRLKKHTFTQSDYTAIVHKIHMKKDVVNSSTLITYKNALLKSRKVLTKYNNAENGSSSKKELQFSIRLK